MEGAVFGRGSARDSADQTRMDQEIGSLARSHQCRVARFGGGGTPSWEIKVVEPDGIHSTLVVGYKPFLKKIELFDDRGRAVAEALRELLETSFNLPELPIVPSRRG